MQFKKIGNIIKPKNINSWWSSHAMAPTAILIDKEIIRIFIGCWDENNISRIGHIDVLAKNPKKIVSISSKPDLDIGQNGCFDENGVFPGHVNLQDGKIFLHYTGFQLGHKIRHFNFGGIAVYENNKFERISKSPILDRADEGLFVRAGSSSIFHKGEYYTVYSAGSGWANVAGKLRPKYDVFIQKTKDGLNFKKKGTKILSCNSKVEHGLGRPQIIKLENKFYIFYTRRLKSFNYFFGVARSKDLKDWERIDSEIKGISHSTNSFDSKMVYFPNAIKTSYGIYLFYSGNNFGEGGLGVAKITKI